MDYTTVGRTELVVSRLCLGTATFGSQCDEGMSGSILDAAHDHGVTFFDTADIYPLGGSLATVGRSEEILGRWLASRGLRSTSVVASKCGGRVGPRDVDAGASKKHILRAVDDSLARLQTDYIDLYQLHFYDGAAVLDETLEALDTIVQAGKVRYVGVSNWLAFRVARAIGRSEALGVAPISCIQPRYNLVFREPERELLPLCAEEGLGVISYNPLAGGLLTGKHEASAVPTQGTRFTLGDTGASYRDRYWHDREFETVRALRPMAEDLGITMATLAVGWVLSHPVVSAAIIGASNPAQLSAAVEAVERPISSQTVEELDELTVAWRRGDAER